MNTEKIKNYLLTLDEKDQHIVQKIIDNTIYLTTEQMVNKVRISLDVFKTLHTKYNLFIPNDKIGSEHYILTQLYKEITPIQVIYGYDDIITNDYPIIILDDAIYSSYNMCLHVDLLTYNKNIKNKFYIIVAVLSTSEVSLLTSGFNTCIISELTLTNLLASNLFNDYDHEYFYENFGCESSLVLPLFFEHKIANEFGSYQFYHKLIETPISRKCIDIITKDDIENIINYYKTL
jgi:hypothetical protein